MLLMYLETTRILFARSDVLVNPERRVQGIKIDDKMIQKVHSSQQLTNRLRKSFRRRLDLLDSRSKFLLVEVRGCDSKGGYVYIHCIYNLPTKHRRIVYFFLVRTSRVIISNAPRASLSGNTCNASIAFEQYCPAKSLVFSKPSEAATNSRACCQYSQRGRYPLNVPCMLEFPFNHRS
jgi:hypothetical protein